MDTPLGSDNFIDPDDMDAIATGSMWSGGRLTHAALRLGAAFVTLARLNQDLKHPGGAGAGAAVQGGGGSAAGGAPRTRS